MSENGTTIPKSTRSISGLRETLFETLDELRGGTMEPTKAKAVMYVAQVILNTVQVQMQVERLQSRSELQMLPDVPLNVRSPRLGKSKTQRVS